MACLICGSDKPVILKSTRIQSLKDASLKRGDGLSATLEQGATDFLCHRNCISTYCSKTHIERALKKFKLKDDASSSTSTKRSRRSETKFNFLEHCLFCGETCEVEKPKKNPR